MPAGIIMTKSKPNQLSACYCKLAGSWYTRYHGELMTFYVVCCACGFHDILHFGVGF